MTKHINIDTILDFNTDENSGGFPKELREYYKQQFYDLMLEIIGEDELKGRPDVAGSPTASKLWTRDTLREEQRQKLEELFND